MLTHSRSIHTHIFDAEFKALKNEVKLQNYQINMELSKRVARLPWARSIYSSDWVLPYVARLNGYVSSSEDMDHDHVLYNVSVRLQVLFCLKVFAMELRVKRVSLLSFIISPIGQRIVLMNVVPDDSPIMIACQTGNSSAVWNLLSERKASVNDVTAKNFSPLSVSVFY